MRIGADMYKGVVVISVNDDSYCADTIKDKPNGDDPYFVTDMRRS